ncbi:MAG: ROK family protein [Solirubrobacterales bacterium]
MKSERLAGIDLGGTKILSGIFGDAGEVLGTDERPTPCDCGPDGVVGCMMESLGGLLGQLNLSPGDLKGLVVGSPGPLDPETGIVHQTPNLPGWEQVPLAAMLTGRLKIPVALENDANLAALAEQAIGYAGRHQVLLYLTVSTGIGGGLILGGSIFHGAHGAAGEFGHMTVEPNGPMCNCQNRGCLEMMASGTAVARAGRLLVGGGYAGRLAELTGDDPSLIDARMVAEAARQGDGAAERILLEAFDYLGIGIANLVNALNPNAVVLGGGLMQVGERYYERIWEQLRQRTYPRLRHGLEILPSRLGPAAGLLGCGLYAQRIWGGQNHAVSPGLNG